MTSVSPSKWPIEWPSDVRGPSAGCSRTFRCTVRTTSIHSCRSTTRSGSRVIDSGVPGAPQTRRIATGSQRNVGSSLNGS